MPLVKIRKQVIFTFDVFNEATAFRDAQTKHAVLSSPEHDVYEVIMEEVIADYTEVNEKTTNR